MFFLSLFISSAFTLIKKPYKILNEEYIKPDQIGNHFIPKLSLLDKKQGSIYINTVFMFENDAFHSNFMNRDKVKENIRKILKYFPFLADTIINKYNKELYIKPNQKGIFGAITLKNALLICQHHFRCCI